VKKHQHARRIAARNHGIFARHAIHIDGSEFHVVCNGPNSTHLVDTLLPFRPTNRPWLQLSSARTASISLWAILFLLLAAEAVIEER
jgi:hypothetical protein